MTQTNQFEKAARLEKVRAIVKEIDIRVGDRAWKKSLHIARWLERLTDDGWKLIAEAADVRTPSDRSRAAVVATYRDRACDAILPRRAS